LAVGDVDARGRGNDEEKLFVTRNSRHFDFPTVHERFAAEQCALVFSFADARAGLGV
jgi:hypothetical protein